MQFEKSTLSIQNKTHLNSNDFKFETFMRLNGLRIRGNKEFAFMGLDDLRIRGNEEFALVGLNEKGVRGNKELALVGLRSLGVGAHKEFALVRFNGLGIGANEEVGLERFQIGRHKEFTFVELEIGTLVRLENLRGGESSRESDHCWENEITHT
jgi:hypothetical protein